MKPRLLFSAALLAFCTTAAGQYYETGQDPASLKWKQIRSTHFNVIFPESFEKQGIEYSRMLERAAESQKELYPEKKFRIPVVIEEGHM
ncbi:MAG: hypothetical protein MUD02_08220, partial [Bacteroidales bacterium]|nr:hypothetical protein [Bacteroidales bacterium]